MKTKNTSRQDTEGSALLAALLVVMTVGALSATAIQMQVSSLRQQETANDRKRAFYLAEAGLSEALLSLRDGGLGQVGTKAMPAGFGEGYVFTSAVEDAYGNFIVHSTGIAPRARHRLGLSIERQVLSPGSLGFFGDEALTVGGGTQLSYVDSVRADEKLDRESLAGAVVGLVIPGATPTEEYNGTVYPENVGPRFGGNGTIDVENVGSGAYTNLQADVVRGPAAVLDIQLGATVSGATAAQAEAVVMPKLNWPAFALLGSVNLTTGISEALTTTENHYPNVTVSGGAVLRIVGPFRASMDTLTIATGATLEIDSSAGPVELHVSDSVNFAGGSSVTNVTLDAGGLHLLVHGDDSVAPAVQLRMTGTFHGVLYAPLAAVALPRGLAWTGSAVARTLDIPRDSTLIFDSAVISEVAAQIFYIPISWNLLAAPKDIANPMAYNPEATYAGLGITAATPAIAWQPVEQVIKYEGHDEKEYVYRGVTGGIDVDLVATTLETINAIDPRFIDEAEPDGVFVQR